MRCIAPSSSLTLGIILMMMTLASQCYGNLQVGYYSGKCRDNDVEQIILDVVMQRLANRPATVANLVRLQFHDCIVRGCDASLLLDGPKSEKTSAPNLTLDSFDLLDAAKEAVERACPGVVSCADILIIATRAAVFLSGGKWYDVETGRRDGFISRESEATAILPSTSIPIPKAIRQFESMGLSKEDFVVLLGGHTVGNAHCENFQDRLYNFRNTSKPDSRLSSSFLRSLRHTCPKDSKLNNTTFLDQAPDSQFKIDNGYYKQILKNKGILEIDANIAQSKLTNNIVTKLAHTKDHFYDKFGPAMVKLARYGVLTGEKGEIRKSCRVVNK